MSFLQEITNIKYAAFNKIYEDLELCRYRPYAHNDITKVTKIT